MSGTSTELERDLRRCAFHESGHAVMVEFLNKGTARIEIVQSGPAKYSGMAYYRTPTCPQIKALCAMAGGAAEALDADFGKSRADQIDAAMARMSPGDISNAGKFDRSLVDMALNICVANWAAIGLRAAREIEYVKAKGGALA